MDEKQTIEKLTEMGGKLWEKGSYRRIYFDDGVILDAEALAGRGQGQTMSEQADPYALEADSPALGLIRDCLAISSGSIGVLIGSSSYAEIDAVRRNWILFLAGRPAETARCRNWVEAWEWFWETSHE